MGANISLMNIFNESTEILKVKKSKTQEDILELLLIYNGHKNYEKVNLYKFLCYLCLVLRKSMIEIYNNNMDVEKVGIITE